MLETSYEQLVSLLEQNADSSSSITVNPAFFNGSCLKIDGNNGVYFVMSGVKHLVPSADTYNSIFASWDKIIEITGKAGKVWEAVVNIIPNGDKITEGAHIIKSKTSAAQYLLTGNKKYLINSLDELKACNFKSCQTYPQIIIDAIPEGEKNAFVPADKP